MANLKTPCAILSSTQQTKVNRFDDDDNSESIHHSILELVECKRYKRKNMLNGIVGSWCVGSSYGWLVLLDKEGVPLLLNLSSLATIKFPPLPQTFINPVTRSYFVECLRKTFIVKAVVMEFFSSEYSAKLNHILVIIYGCQCKIAYCKDESWVELSDAKHSYCDIVIRKNYLFALTQDGAVEGWDLCQLSPKKLFFVRPTMEIDNVENSFLGDKFSTQLYLVLSRGEFLMVVRYIGNFVNQYGKVIEEGDLLDSEDTHPLICPYKTMHFDVYKFDSENTKWKKMKSIHDQVLFLGANESTSLSTEDFASCEANSIYFTDDRWIEMDLDYMYGGHDLGVFSLEDGKIDLILPYANKIDPPPIWVVPTPKI